MTAYKGNIYEVTVAGEYYSSRHGQKGVSRYELTVKLDEQAKDQGFLGVIRKNVLNRALKAKYPDYKRFRTHYIIGVLDITNPQKPKTINELSYMDRKTIVKFILTKKLPIEPNLYPEISDLRQAVRDYRNNKEQFLLLQEKRSKTKGKELGVARAVDELNPDLDKPQFSDKEFAKTHAVHTKPTEQDPDDYDMGDEKDDLDDDLQSTLGLIPKNQDDIDEPIEGPPTTQEEEITIPDFDDEDDLKDLVDGI